MVKRFESTIPSRSQKYQYLLIERSVEDSFLASFSNDESTGSWLNPHVYNERRLELEDLIKERFYVLLKENATDLQYRIFTMLASGMSQVEVAKVMKCNQSGITKCIRGNSDYSYKKTTGKPRYYGGLIKKMKRVISKDEIMQDLLTELNEDFL